MTDTTAQAPDSVFFGHSSGADDRTMTLFGLDALLKEMASEGVSADQVLEGTGVTLDHFTTPRELISRRQRLAIYRNAQRLACRPEVGLLAGARQRVSDFGIYGYALASSRILGAALDLSLTHFRHAGPVLPISSSIEGSVGILRSHDPWSVGQGSNKESTGMQRESPRGHASIVLDAVNVHFTAATQVSDTQHLSVHQFDNCHSCGILIA